MSSYNERYMLGLLVKKYSKIRPGTTTDRYVRAAHVRLPYVYEEGLSYGQAGRIADFIVLDTQGTGEILGFEVKVSRSDWLREMQDIEKSSSWHSKCHKWFLVVPDLDIVKKNEVPEGWGVMALDKNNNLRIRISPIRNTAVEAFTLLELSLLGRAIASTAVKFS